MKKILLFATCFIFLSGCSAIQIRPAEKIALQIAAQRVGYYVAKNNPSIVSQAKLVAQGIVSNRNADIAKVGLEMAIMELSKQFPYDPLLEADLRLIASGLNLNIPSAKIDLSQVNSVIQAFLNGMEIGSRQASSMDDEVKQAVAAILKEWHEQKM